MRSPGNQNDTRPLLNRHGNFRGRAYERDPRHFDNNNTSEAGMTSSEHEVEDDVSNSIATVNEFTYHGNHLRWARDNRLLQNRPSRQDALWHLCPYCIEDVQHQHPPSHVSANLNVSDTLQHPPTAWNDETSQAESVIDGFECWG